MPAYSIPLQAAKLLSTGILNNPLHDFPADIKEAAGLVKYVGSDEPCMPINWRLAESIASIKGLEGAMLNILLKRKYGIPYQKIVLIREDHAQLYFISPMVFSFDSEGIFTLSRNSKFAKHFPSYETHDVKNVHMNIMCTTMYKTKDCRFYHLHGSMNPRVTLTALDVPKSHETEVSSLDRAGEIIAEKVAEYEAEAIETLMNVKYRQAGTVAHSKEEYLASEHGKAHAHIGLYELHHIPNAKQLPTWWIPVDGKTTPERPLFGLKIIDLTRVIAGAAIARDLAELGASVLRITCPGVSDINVLNAEMGWGKWNTHLDLKKEEDRTLLQELILEADVVVEGYRPGVMAKWGFGKDDILQLFENKEKGIIYAHENCYGWHGPWTPRSGWQQISDANTGVSYSFGRAMGVDEPVTPVWPNSDFCTGASGAIGIIQALIERAEKGGSYVVDAALNYYNQWLVNSCGEYLKDVWDAVYVKAGCPVFHARDNMLQLIPPVLGILKATNAPILKDEYFETRDNPGVVAMRTVKPVLTFPEGVVKPGFQVGSRPNGVDKPAWPADLATPAIV
ncbi:CoA-transferase family III domain-containing protein [Desarmillaria tabescens]|uniref:CoA-transferase family III domain-containing protein n=1 Tax=Armillaria tabescens TaxID=1929756 RepID=A0AA39NNZ4_ARMTA|nr:CoA-transferase family III domain-containing protein [Desarmillaria tabescens]KAK0469143.1 CoA-transferase family III domain-containing protein [Desarmillaria tabescens]